MEEAFLNRDDLPIKSNLFGRHCGTCNSAPSIAKLISSIFLIDWALTLNKKALSIEFY